MASSNLHNLITVSFCGGNNLALLAVVAWADLTDDPRRKPMAAWTKDYFKRHGGVRVDAQLRNMLSVYQPRDPIPGREKEFRERVLKLAREIQEARDRGAQK